MSSLSRIARRSAIAAALSCLALPVLTQSPSTYTVEIVVFRTGGDAGGADDAQPRLVVTGDDVSIGSGASRKLGGSVARLNGNGFTVIGHAAWKQAPAAFQSQRGVAAGRLGIAGLSGKVILERDRYLHLGFDLVVEDGGRRHHLSQYRKQVRSGDIQYFDHPAIGILALVSSD